MRVQRTRFADGPRPARHRAPSRCRRLLTMRHSLIALAAFCLLACSAICQPAPVKDPLLERLVGAWVLRGTIAGKDTTHDIVAEWVLGRQYLRIHERSREKDGKGQAQYEAGTPLRRSINVCGSIPPEEEASPLRQLLAGNAAATRYHSCSEKGTAVSPSATPSHTTRAAIPGSGTWTTCRTANPFPSVASG
jgi:hypothetical protein